MYHLVWVDTRAVDTEFCKISLRDSVDQNNIKTTGIATSLVDVFVNNNQHLTILQYNTSRSHSVALAPGATYMYSIL